jgi:hypothetical protein
MYIFVFLWTPALKTSEEEVSYSAAASLHVSACVIRALPAAIPPPPNAPPPLPIIDPQAAEKSGEALQESTSQFLGLIFAVFMVCMMAGSSLYRVGSELYGQRAVRFAPLVMHVTALFAIGSTYWFYDNKTVVYLSFLTFEVCCGVFFPAYGTTAPPPTAPLTVSPLPTLLRSTQTEHSRARPSSPCCRKSPTYPPSRPPCHPF